MLLLAVTFHYSNGHFDKQRRHDEEIMLMEMLFMTLLNKVLKQSCNYSPFSFPWLQMNKHNKVVNCYDIVSSKLKWWKRSYWWDLYDQSIEANYSHFLLVWLKINNTSSQMLLHCSRKLQVIEEKWLMTLLIIKVSKRSRHYSHFLLSWLLIINNTK